MLKQIELTGTDVLIINSKTMPEKVYAVGPTGVITPCRIISVTYLLADRTIPIGVETSGRKRLFFDLQDMFETLKEAAIVAEKRAQNGLKAPEKAHNGKGSVSVESEGSESVARPEAAP